MTEALKSGRPCANCLAKRKKHARSRWADSQKHLDLAKNSALTQAPAMKDAVSRPGGYHPTCKTCGAKLGPESGRESGNRRQYCSGRCRLLSWAARELLRASREGRAAGLVDAIAELKKLEK